MCFLECVSSMPPCVPNWEYSVSMVKVVLLSSCYSADTVIVLNIQMRVSVLFWRIHSVACQCLHGAFPNEPHLCWAVSGGGPRAYLRGGGGGWGAKLWPTGEIRDTETNGSRLEWWIQSSELTSGPANQHDEQIKLQGLLVVLLY